MSGVNFIIMVIDMSLSLLNPAKCGTDKVAGGRNKNGSVSEFK